MTQRAKAFQAVEAVYPGIWNRPGAIAKMDALIDIVEPRDRGDGWLPKAVALMHEFEGCKLTAYPDPGTGGKPWTIGWGSTTDEQGKPIQPGTTWTQERADNRFQQDVAKFAAGVTQSLGPAKATDNQFAAMVSFAYNVGLSAFSNSTLLKLHRAGDYGGAAGQFEKWVNAGGKRMNGLVRRRAAEAALYVA